MININTINELSEYGIGGDILKLESYVYYLKIAKELGVSTKELDRLEELLLEIKPESKVLKDLEQLEVSNHPVDQFKFNNIVNKFSNNSTFNAFIYTYEKGYQILINYNNGRFGTAYILSNDKYYKDISKCVKSVLPDYIELLKDVKRCTLYGEVITSNRDFTNIKNIVELTKKILNEKELNDEKIIINDIDNDLGCCTKWEKMEVLEKIGFNACSYCIIREVDNNLLEEVKIESYNHFSTEDNYFNSIMIEDDSIGCKEIVKVDMSCFNSIIYSAMIKNIEYINSSMCMVCNIEIEPIKLGNKTIESIKLTNLDVIDKGKYTIGSPIRFRYNGITTELV